MNVSTSSSFVFLHFIANFPSLSSFSISILSFLFVSHCVNTKWPEWWREELMCMAIYVYVCLRRRTISTILNNTGTIAVFFLAAEPDACKGFFQRLDFCSTGRWLDFSQHMYCKSQHLLCVPPFGTFYCMDDHFSTLLHSKEKLSSCPSPGLCRDSWFPLIFLSLSPLLHNHKG